MDDTLLTPNGVAAAEALGLALGAGAAVGPHATATPTAARDCRKRLREMVGSELIEISLPLEAQAL